MEVMWKVVTAILNLRFTASITYHVVLHGFRAGCGTGIAILEDKLLQQLAALREEVLYVIFLDLHKAYDDLDRSWCLEILEGYGVGPKSRRLLTNYWRRLTMVAIAGGYYGTAFGGKRGVMQGNPLSPNIFNVVVDTIVRHWVHGVMEEAEAQGEMGREGRNQAALFYADDGMVVSFDPAWLQGAFTALVGLFDRVGLRTNVGKTVRMVCHSCQAGAVNRTEEAYRRRITGKGRSYAERQRERVKCLECGELLAVESILSHLMTRHGKAAGRRRLWTPHTESGANTYRMSFLTRGGPRRCPVEGCPGTLATRTAMRVHFVHWHVQDTVVMLEEGNSPHPRCTRCDMQVPRKALNWCHLGTAQCEKGAERKRRRLAETETRESLERAFSAYGKPMEAVTEFRYLGRILTATDDNWLEVAGNIKKARRSWGRMSWVLGREGADPKVSRTFYIDVVQQELLFGAEMWVLTKNMELALDAF